MTEESKSPTKYVMLESGLTSGEDEINLLELTRSLLQAWKSIVGITIICFGLAVAYVLYAPEVFKAGTLLAPTQEGKSSSSSALNQFGGLAAMAGISIPSDSNMEQVLATLKSRKFLRQYIDGKKLMPILFEEIWDAEKNKWLVDTIEEEPNILLGINVLKSALSVDEDEKSELINLSISWKDPEVAAEWANDLVKQLNKQLREKAIADSQKRVGYLEQELAKTTLQDMRSVIYNLLESEKQKAMLANVNEDFALKVIDPAIAGTLEKPKRKLIVILGTVCGGFLGIFFVFFTQFVNKLKSSIS